MVKIKINTKPLTKNFKTLDICKSSMKNLNISANKYPISKER
ncbi:hypothetical protein CBF_3219 [Clostridium botulinum F str. 230613]|nr:hypothetical protein CBF_3219 [Clostridium botulinum F str. 230613]